MSGNNNGMQEYTSSAEVNQRLKKAKTQVTGFTIGFVCLVAAFFFISNWQKSNNVDYIGENQLKIARTGSASTGSPWKASSFVGQLAWSALFETDSTFTEVNPQLAESIDVSSDGLTYTVVLKEGLSWSDGTPLTMDDVVFSIESALLCTYTQNIMNVAFQQIKGATEWQEIGVESWENGGSHSLEGLSVNGNTLTIEMENPYSSFPFALTQFVIFPKHALEHLNPSTYTDSTDEMSAFLQNPVCTGMYMVDLVNEDGDLELIHNPYYFGTHSDIERVILYGDYQTMYIDYYSTSNVTDMVSYRNMSGFEEYQVNVQFYRYFVFNLLGGYDNAPKVPQLDEDGKQVLDDDGEVVMVSEYGDDREENLPMQNYLLRQAISLAIDRESIAKDVYLGNARHDFALTGNEEYVSFLTDHNVDLAKKLLAQSGYDVERPILIHHYHTDTNSMALLARVQEALEEIGLTVVVEKTGGNVNMYEVREYDILLKGYAAQSPIEWYTEYLSTANNVQNLLGTDEFDDLIISLEGATSDAMYESVLAEMQELDRTTMYRMPIVTTDDCTYINGNRIFVPEDMEFGNNRYRSDLRMSEWYVKKG